MRHCFTKFSSAPEAPKTKQTIVKRAFSQQNRELTKNKNIQTGVTCVAGGVVST